MISSKNIKCFQKYRLYDNKKNAQVEILGSLKISRNIPIALATSKPLFFCALSDHWG
ncbi:hypothetical protein OIU76_009842 [Salix suchowensis]|nr:hypothetical protein OIU76_009842 [Salix suchowensis]